LTRSRHRPDRNRLRELGWIEGRTILIEYRWADGRADRIPELAAELVCPQGLERGESEGCSNEKARNVCLVAAQR
jgi:hypothetical protein